MREYIYRLLTKVLNTAGVNLSRYPNFPIENRESDLKIWGKIKNLTLTSPERIGNLLTAVRYVTNNNIPGAIVECGVWRGGSMIAAALQLEAMSSTEKELHLFDTFEGMTEASPIDTNENKVSADAMLLKSNKNLDPGGIWAYASISDVRRNFETTNYPKERIKFHKGDVRRTLFENSTQEIKEISILRLDTDWYDSTKAELEVLYPKLVVGGVLIIDDYGYWNGAKQAVDEYFKARNEHPFLARVDNAARFFIKMA